MLKEKRNEIIITTLMSLLPLAIGLLLWNKLPDQIPVHFNYSGVADSYYPKFRAVFMIGLFMPLIHLLSSFLAFSDPKIKSVSNKVTSLILWIVPVTSILISLLMYGHALNINMDTTVICTIFIGILFIVIGNYLPKCKQNYTIGVKTPWALNDNENWDKTHRFSSYLFILTGVIMMLSLLFRYNIGTYIIFAALMICGILPFIYSYMIYRKKNKNSI